MKFFDYVKNIFFLLIIIQLTPFILKGIRTQYKELFVSRTKIAVLPIRGILHDSAYYVKQLTTFFTDQEIKGIVLKIECPGSASGTGELIYKEILSLKNEYHKPIITLVENSCLSGGYWIACASDYIITPGTALVGSIGATFPSLFQLREFIEYHNIRYKDIKAGTYKTVANPFVDITAQEQELLQDVLDNTYHQFAQAVAKARKLSLNEMAQWADGKIFTGQQAHKLRLVDELGGPQQIIAILKQKALIDTEIEWVHPPQQAGLLGSLFGGSSSDDENSMFTSVMNAVCTHLENRYGIARTG